MTNKAIGKYGEELAKNFLIKKGFKILEMNYHYSKMAEIDIIASLGDVVHFVEVKTRTQTFFGAPIEAITKKKLNSIFQCGNFYLQNSKIKYKKFQIDFVGIVLSKNNEPKIDFLENLSLY